MNNKKLETLQYWKTFYMYAGPVCAIGVVICGLMWNRYGELIKKEESKQPPKTETGTGLKPNFIINGDYIQGNKISQDTNPKSSKRRPMEKNISKTNTTPSSQFSVTGANYGNQQIGNNNTMIVKAEEKILTENELTELLTFVKKVMSDNNSKNVGILTLPYFNAPNVITQIKKYFNSKKLPISYSGTETMSMEAPSIDGIKLRVDPMGVTILLGNFK